MCVWKGGWFRLLYGRRREGEREAGDSEIAGTMVSGVRLTEEKLRLDTGAVLRAEGCATDSILREKLKRTASSLPKKN